MNKKHLLTLGVMAGLGFWFWHKKQKPKPPSVPMPWPREPIYAQGPSVVPGSEGGNVPLSHFAPMGALNLDSIEDFGAVKTSCPGNKILVNGKCLTPQQWYNKSRISATPVIHVPSLPSVAGSKPGQTMIGTAAGPVYAPQVCPAGYSYNASTGACIPFAMPIPWQPTPMPMPITCPTGYSYNASTGACIPTGVVPVPVPYM